MDKFVNFLSGNPWLNLVFLILAILSVLVTLILYSRSKKEKMPLYNIKSFDLVRGRLKKIEGVRISYREEEVDDLTLTRLAFWNKGRDTIERRDIAQADPLRIVVPEGAKILEVRIDYIHNPVNDIKFTISKDRLSVLLSFDYLHTLEGCVLSIFHTAVGSQVEIKGTIKGAGKIKNGVIERDKVLDSFFDATLGKILPSRDNMMARKLVLSLSIPFFIPFIFLISPLDTILRVIYKSPAQFTLEDSE